MYERIEIVWLEIYFIQFCLWSVYLYSGYKNGFVDSYPGYKNVCLTAQFYYRVSSIYLYNIYKYTYIIHR